MPNENAELIPQSAIVGLLACVPYMPPNALAELVDYWSDVKEYLPLAQIAFDEGDSNVGANDLAEYVAGKRTKEEVLKEWLDAGVQIEFVIR